MPGEFPKPIAKPGVNEAENCNYAHALPASLFSNLTNLDIGDTFFAATHQHFGAFAATNHFQIVHAHILFTDHGRLFAGAAPDLYN